MINVKISLIFFLSVSALSSELDFRELVVKLSSEDYEDRQEAHMDLCGFPAEYASIFLGISMKSPDPEVRVRLFSVAKSIFLKKVLPQDERYQRLFGMLGATYVEYYEEKDDEEYRKGYECDGNTFDGIRIVFPYPDCPAEKVLREWDIILEIDGQKASDFFNSNVNPMNAYGPFLPERGYRLKIRRYKDLERIKQRECISVKDEYEEMEVRVTTIREDGFRVDREKLFDLMERAWTAFVISHSFAGKLVVP